MNESFKTDPSLATSARAAKESGSYLCASNVTPTAVRFIVSVFLCLLCSCRMPSTQMTCSHFRKNRPKKRQKPAGCRSCIISKNRPVPIFGRSTGASLVMSHALCMGHKIGNRTSIQAGWPSNGAFPLHGTVRFGTARYGTVRLSSGQFAFPRQFSTAIEWAGLFTRRYNCAASTAVTSS